MPAAAVTRVRISETIRHSELKAALGVLAGGLAEVRVDLGQRRDELLVAREVVRVEQVEHLGAQLERLAPAEAEGLVEAQVDALVVERAVGAAGVEQDPLLVDPEALGEVLDGVADARGELDER